MQLKKDLPLKNFIKSLHGLHEIVIIGPLKISPQTLDQFLNEHPSALVLFVDGGLKHKRKIVQKKFPELNYLSLGDNDSNKSIEKIDFLLPKNKDFSDLAFALKGIGLSKNHWTKITLLGFSSHKNETRFDHLLFNLGHLYDFTENFGVVINLDHHFYFYPKGSHVLKHKGPFSLIGLKNVRLKLTGQIKFPLKKWTPLNQLDSKGLSNVAKGPFKIDSTGTIIFYRPL